MINSAKKAILDQYSGIVMNSGVESNEIAKDMEKKYGGYWMVGIFSADFDVAYTITRRSKSYGVFRIDDKMILIAKDGNRKLHFGPVY
uniref:Dynein light chain n=1 Tax=Panagrolaimus sp. JU765 TaxID=591449 RepID=A0AC34QHN1_9BILA